MNPAAACRAWLGLALLVSGCEGNGGSVSGATPFVPPPPPVPLVAVSAATPFTAGCDGPAQSGTLYANAEVEPYAAVNPLNPDNLVAVWQQDRWSNGGARGLMAAVSFDGGASWSPRVVPFSRCAGGSILNGGDYLRATDPWVDFGPDGTAYFMSLSFTDSASVSAMLVSRSLDGGDSWGNPVTLIRDQDAALFNDKNTLTADPTKPGAAYAVWDRLDEGADRGPALFARTLDGGLSWEPARIIHDPDFGQTIGNLIAVLPDGTLVNVFVEIDYASGDASLRIIRSLDRGLNWIAPVTVADLRSVGVRDPQTGVGIRSGAGAVPAIAVRRSDGRLAIAWGDARFSNFSRDGIALSYSDDGGDTWSAPVAVNGAPAAAAFTPTLQFLDDGTLGLAYYDLRDNTSSGDTLLSTYWLARSRDGATWSETRISGPFDMDLAPRATLGRGTGYFPGDYMALVSAAGDFLPFFIQTGSSTADRTGVFTVRITPEPMSTKSAYAALADPGIQPSAEARARIRAAIKAAVPRGRHDAPHPFPMPDFAILP